MKYVIYQLFVRLFGNSSANVRINGTGEENGCGRFSGINNKALKSLKDLGISHIWYTGIIEHAVAADYSRYGVFNDYPEIVKGRAGSPYAIKDYYDVNPDLADNPANRMGEFEALVRRTHNAGMKVIIDFVPNHLARVYKSDSKPDAVTEDFGLRDRTDISFSPLNDFYYLPGEELKLPDELYRKAAVNEYRENPVLYREFPARVTGNDCFKAAPGVGDWYETVKLNYGIDYHDGKKLHLETIPPVWKKMESVLLYWAGKNIDGFRVDMAEMVPLEFWEWVIPAIKQKYPGVIFIAEIYQPALYRDFIERGGFDYLYDKMDFYDNVRSIIENRADTGAVTRVWQEVGELEKYMVRFLENHDEQRIASKYFAGDPWKAIPGMVLAATMNCGPLLIYSGQEVGEAAEGCSGFSGDDGRTTIFDYWIVPNHQRWMNHGEFDGSLLTADMMELRNNYAGIFRMCNEHKLFSTGAFYDLMWVNNDLKRHSAGKIYTYLRFDHDNIALIILNFGNMHLQGLHLRIPGDAWDSMQVRDTVKVNKKYIFPYRGLLSAETSVERGKTFVFDAPPLSAAVWVLNKDR